MPVPPAAAAPAVAGARRGRRPQSALAAAGARLGLPTSRCPLSAASELPPHPTRTRPHPRVLLTCPRLGSAPLLSCRTRPHHHTALVRPSLSPVSSWAIAPSPSRPPCPPSPPLLPPMTGKLQLEWRARSGVEEAASPRRAARARNSGRGWQGRGRGAARHKRGRGGGGAGRAARPHSEAQVRQAAPWTESPRPRQMKPVAGPGSQARLSTPAPPWACHLSGFLPVAPALLLLPGLPSPRLSSLSPHLLCARRYSPEAAAVACQARRRGVAKARPRPPVGGSAGRHGEGGEAQPGTNRAVGSQVGGEERPGCVRAARGGLGSEPRATCRRCRPQARPKAHAGGGDLGVHRPPPSGSPGALAARRFPRGQMAPIPRAGGIFGPCRHPHDAGRSADAGVRS